MIARSWAAVLGGWIVVLGCSSQTPESERIAPQDASPIDVGNVPDAGEADAPKESTTPPTPFDGPIALSETGLYLDILSRTPALGVMPYEVRYPLWSDGAGKQRWLWLPQGSVIDTTNMDQWKFPLGTKAWKEFYVGTKLVETRFLHKRTNGWLEVAYVWNDDGSDAYATPEGLENASGSHNVPNVDQCSQCHDGAGDVLIGVSAIQLSKETGGGFISQLIAAGRLTDPPGVELTVPGDGVVEDALGYLHGNCGNCHNDQSFLAPTHTLRLKLLSSNLAPEETPTYKTAIGTLMSHVLGGTSLAVVPGNPGMSQLHYRMSVRDLDQMPPTGTEVVDTDGLATIESWISALPP